jgi:hypothetical protein
MPSYRPGFPAIAVRQPFADLIVLGIKKIENRTRITHFRGNVLIHASKGRPWMEDVSKRDLARLKKFSREVETGDYYPLRGAIVGMARITGCVESSSDRFFEGPIGWTLADAVAFKDPIPYSGTLGFFYVPLRVLKGTEAATAKPGTFDRSP